MEASPQTLQSSISSIHPPQTIDPNDPNVDRVLDELAEQIIAMGLRDEAIAVLEDLVPPLWPTQYVNRETGRVYQPHHEAEARLVYSDTPRYPILLGGEGAGKSVSAIIKANERIGRGMSGILASPDLPHFKRSLWPEFQRWCPWDQVVPKHQVRGEFDWEPYAPFILAFRNGARLYCGGMDEPGAWEGPNVSFALLDEARRKKDASALKVLDGRVRIPGPNGEPPQIIISTTPRMHWLYDYYGPLQVLCQDCGGRRPVYIQRGEPFQCAECQSPHLKVEDPFEQFKRDSSVVVLLTKDNEPNLQDGFAERRAQTLTAAEIRVLLNAEWEDIEEGQPFLPSMIWWDECRYPLEPLDKSTPLVVAADAAPGRLWGQSDCFAILAVSRHPERPHDAVAVRYTKTWRPRPGTKLDYIGTSDNPGPERELLHLCGWKIDENGQYVRTGDGYNVKCVTFDPTELNDLAQRFRRHRVAWMEEFGQVNVRTKADSDLLRLVQEKRVVHSGEDELRTHIANADRKLDIGNHRLRIVKRMDSLPIDLAVCLSMAAYKALYLRL